MAALEARLAELEERLEKATTPKVWLDRSEAAEYLGCSKSWLEKRADVPGMVRLPGTRHPRYNREALDLWISGG